MTKGSLMKQMLFERGMFEADAVKVVEAVIADPANEAMQSRWGDHVEGYPPQMVNVLWFTTKRHALEHIEANCPQAWFKPLFDDAALPMAHAARAEGKE
jgi:hypothetical protein